MSYKIINDIKKEIQSLKDSRNGIDHEIDRLESMLEIYTKSTPRFEIIKDLTKKETFATLIRGWLKEADRPLFSKELRQMYNTHSGRLKLDANRFSSRMSTTSESKGWYFYQRGKGKNNKAVFLWFLNEWARDGQIQPKYQQLMKKRVQESIHDNIE